MKTYYDCIPCLIQQTLHTARLVTRDEKMHEHILREVLDVLKKMSFDQSPPVMGRHIYRIIREVSGIEDPYKDIKNQFNRLALDLYPDLKKKVEQSPNSLETAIRFAIAGNVIDFGLTKRVEQSHIYDTIAQAITEPLFGNVGTLCDSINLAEKILYLGDNSGEIVFDRLLIEQLPADKITFAVRGRAVINDATMADAIETGVADLVKVIDNGTDAPGTVLNDCSETFQRVFNTADLVIAKGQGNYEALSDVDKNIFFLFKAKCSVVAKDAGCEEGSLVVGV